MHAAVEEGAEEGLGPQARRHRAPGERAEDRVVDEAVVRAECGKRDRPSTVDLATRVRGLLCDQIAGAILQSEGGHGSEWRVAEEELADTSHGCAPSSSGATTTTSTTSSSAR